MKNQNILFFTRTMGLGGTENVVLQLCEIFKPVVNKIVVCSSGGVNVKKLLEMGIIHYEIEDIEQKNPINIIKICKSLKRIKRKENITIIHTHHRMAAFYVRFLGLYKDCFFINTSHNTFSNKKILTRYAYNKANLVACGEMVKRNLTDFYGLKNVTVIHNAVKPFTGEIHIDRELKIDRDSGKYLIGNIGRLSKQKGMEYYIQTIPYVIKKHPEAQFYIIGSGDEEEKLKAMSSNIPVKFLGYRKDIQNLMSQLDLIVLSSLWEGLPLTPIEAFSVGKTIVATDVDGTPEIVKDGLNGLLVESCNSQELAEKLNWIIEHPKEQMKMEKEAKKTFEEEFSFVKLSKSYIDYYSIIKG